MRYFMVFFGLFAVGTNALAMGSSRAGGERAGSTDDCIVLIADFLGLRDGEDLSLRAANQNGKCGLSARVDRSRPVLDLSIREDRATEYGVFPFDVHFWLEESQWQRNRIKDCRVEGNELLVDFVLREKAGWRNNHRYRGIFRKSGDGAITFASLRENRWGLWISPDKRDASCSFESSAE
ncbi:MAG: hypothetical protein NDJ89_08730 [Oligoflexia bacterium]|nr:hypothetical protein [Oligoflexia bacterium]